MKKEFMVLEETAADTQKKIRQWVSQGYKIEIVAQNIIIIDKTYHQYLVVTSLWRWKEN